MVGNLGRAITVALFVWVTTSDAAAQRGQQAGLGGTVTDATGAVLAGVQLTITSPQLIGGPQTTESDATGVYRFPALLPGSYALTAAHPGFERLERSGIELPVGIAVTLDVRLRLTPVATRVDVEGVVPAIDVQSSSSPATIERALLENLPAPLSRSIVDVAELIPGITRGVGFGGPAFVMPISIDGTGSNDPQIGFPAALPSINWLDSMQAVSVAAPAEYGENTNARINVVTRSGANQLSGLGEYWWTLSRWTTWGDELYEWWNAAGQAGGPILRDRLWFFGGVDYFRNTYRPFRFTGPRPPGEPAVENHEPRLLLKLSAAPSAAMRLEGFIERHDGRSYNTNAGPAVSPEAVANSRNAERLYNLRYTWRLSDRTLFEARYGRFDSDSESGPASEEGRSGPAPHFDQATRVNSVNVQQFGETVRRVHAVHAALTTHVDGFAAKSHDVKVGLEHEQARKLQSSRYPGDMLFLDRDGQPELVWLWPGETTRPTVNRTSLFVQDTWRLSERITLEPGLRIGIYRSSLPDTNAGLYENHSVSPRVGAAWDVTADHRTVVRAHYGHYNEGIYTAMIAFLDPLAQSPIITARVVGPGQFEEISRTAVTLDQTSFDPDAGHMYAEEYFAGIEREVVPRLSLRAQYIRRNTRNSLGYIDTGSTWTPADVVDPGPDGRTDTPDDGSLMTIYYNHDPSMARYVLTNPPGAWRRYDALQVVADRRYASGWSLQASYTWGRTGGNFDNDAASNAASSDLASNGNFANPNRAILSTGRTVHDRRHDLKVYGTYAVPFWGLRVSGVYRYMSGAPFARVVTSFPPETQTFAIYAEPVGTYEESAISGADLRVEKTVRVRSASIGLYGDLYNVTNRIVVARVNNVSGSAFGQPRAWTSPREFRASVRVAF
jgi:outer membrane receptor protein involved in Fe transport